MFILFFNLYVLFDVINLLKGPRKFVIEQLILQLNTIFVNSTTYTNNIKIYYS